MKLVIIGANSFIGKLLVTRCRALRYLVFGIDIVAGETVDHVADISESNLAAGVPAGVDAVIHLAAISRDPDCRAQPKLAYETNIMGTVNVMEMAKATGARQVIFASSEWVYGNVTNDGLQREDDAIDITRMTSEYAVSKVVGEKVLGLGLSGTDIALTTLRFGIVYGSRKANWSAVEALFNTVRTQDEVAVGSLRTARRFIHVDDIVSGILAAIGRSGQEVFNLSGDTLISLKDIVETSARLLERTPHVTEKQPDAVSIRNPDNAKARRMLGWSPAVSLEAGLSQLNDFLNKDLA